MEANENLFKDVLPQVGCQQFGDSFRPSELLHRLGGLVNNPTMRLSAQLASGSTQHVTSNAPQPPASSVFHSPSQPPPLPLSATNILRRRTSCSNYELMLQSILSHSCHHRADAVSAAKVLSISPRYGNIVKPSITAGPAVKRMLWEAEHLEALPLLPPDKRRIIQNSTDARRAPECSG